MKCQKCGDRGTYEWAEAARLIGGVHARLCIACLNVFDTHVRALPIWDEMHDLHDRGNDIAAAAVGREEPTEKLAAIRQRLRTIDAEFRAAALQWLSAEPVPAGKGGGA